MVGGHGEHRPFKEVFWTPIKSESSPMLFSPPHPTPKNEAPCSIEKCSPVPRNDSRKKIQKIENYHQCLYFNY